MAGGEFGDVRNGSFDEAIEPGARGGDCKDQAVAILGFQSAAFAVGQTRRENGASHVRGRFGPGNR